MKVLQGSQVEKREFDSDLILDRFRWVSTLTGGGERIICFRSDKEEFISSLRTIFLPSRKIQFCVPFNIISIFFLVMMYSSHLI